MNASSGGMVTARWSADESGAWRYAENGTCNVVGCDAPAHWYVQYTRPGSPSPVGYEYRCAAHPMAQS